MYDEEWQPDQKATNPKDEIGSTKLGTTVVPDVVKFYCALGNLEGALKYGTANWSEAGIRVSIYLDALDRHITKFKSGEWADSKTKVPHLSSALACIGIILDADMRGKVVDDRPPPNPELRAFIDEAEAAVAHLKELFADCDPKHYNCVSEHLEGRLHRGNPRTE